MRNLIRALAFAAALTPLAALGQSAPATMGYHTVYGRIGATPGDTGPGQAIPFATLLAQFSGVQSANTVNAGPTSGGTALPTFRALVGADLPLPGASSLGGVQSVGVVSHTYLTGISTLGVPTVAIPVCADLSNAAASCATDATNASNIGSGTLNTARLPAPLTNATASGNTTKFGTVTGSLTSGHCISADASSNLQDSGSTCGNSAMVLLNTLTCPNISTTACGDTVSLTATYSNYLIVLENVLPATNNATCEIQIHSASGGASFKSTGYIASLLNGNGTTATSTNATTFVPCSVATSSPNVGGINGEFKIYTPSSAAQPAMIVGHTGYINTSAFMTSFSGDWNTNAAVDGFQVTFNTGNMSGTIKVYGIQ